MKQLRKRTIRSIQVRTRTMMWESGFMEHGVPMQIFAFKKSRVLRGGFVVKDFLGFTESGIITDSHGAGMIITPFATIPIEDLIKLDAVVRKLL